MRKTMTGVVATLCWALPLCAQTARPEPVEVPLRLEAGRLMVTALGADGTEHDFVLGLATAVLTESGAARIGGDRSSLTLAGIPLEIESAATVPDAYLPDVDAVGVLGGETLNGYDVLIDAPGGRMLVKPVGRAVRWDGMSLSSPVRLTIFHDVLLRADVAMGDAVVGGLLDLHEPGLGVSAPLGPAIEDGRTDSFRMGYASWPDLPAEVVQSPDFVRWDPQGDGFVLIGAAITYDCAIAVSWAHAELRTCLR